MRRYLARRLLLLVPVLAGVSVIIFMVLHLAPGDPAEIMLGSQATREDLARLRADLGLNEPLHVQYLHWIGHVARGDLGRSLWMKRAVLGEVLTRFRATLLLTATALVLSTTIGVALGVAAATRPNSLLDRLSAQGFATSDLEAALTLSGLFEGRADAPQRIKRIGAGPEP